MIDFYGFETKLLAASIRSVQQLHEMVAYGVDATKFHQKFLKKQLHIL